MIGGNLTIFKTGVLNTPFLHVTLQFVHFVSRPNLRDQRIEDREPCGLRDKGNDTGQNCTRIDRGE